MSGYPSKLVCRFNEVKFCFPPREIESLEIGVSIANNRLAVMEFPNVAIDAYAHGDNKTITVADASAGAADSSTHYSLSFPPLGGKAILTAVDPNTSPPYTLVMYGTCEATE